MNINAAIIQFVQKDAGSTDVEFVTNSNQLSVDEKLENLGEEVLKAYGRNQNTYGGFDRDTNTYQFSSYLNQYFRGAISLVDFSEQTMRFIKQQLESSTPATGGYTLFIRYTNQGDDWLLIVMLKLRASTGVDDDLELIDLLSLDIQHLHEAARINLTRWSNGSDTYLSFVKKRSNQDEVTRYFRLALGCTEQSDSKLNTTQALQALESYCEHKGWERGSEQYLEARKKTFEYFDEKLKDSEPVILDAWSAYINDQEPTSFTDFIRENDIEINEAFAPHKSTYRVLQRIRSKMNTVNISFDVNDVVNGKIMYEPSSNQLIIREISEKLAGEVMKIQEPEE